MVFYCYQKIDYQTIHARGNEVIALNESILETIREMLGPSVDYDAFDTDLIVHINTYLGVLNQLGIGVKGFHIEDANDTWEDFLTEQEKAIGITLNEVKTYLYLRVKMVFDPPASSTLATAMNENIAEIGWRLNARVETELQGKGE